MKPSRIKNTLLILFLTLIATSVIFFIVSGSSNQQSLPSNTQKAGPFEIEINLDPVTPRVGENRIKVTVLDSKSEPVENAAVSLQAEMQAMGSMPKMIAKADLKQGSSGSYFFTLDLNMRGTWNVTLHIAAQDLGHTHLNFDIVTGKSELTFAAEETSQNIYTCPMHPSVKSKTPGPCPICGMDLVESSLPTAASVEEYYTCSMHPSVKSKTPGSCPICGMDLIPAKKDALGAKIVSVDEFKQQLIGVTKAEAKSQFVSKTIATVAYVKHDETSLSDITLKFSGWIGDIHADFSGKSIIKGEPLFTVYSPELVSAQKEYIEAISRFDLSTRATSPLVSAARQRLIYWDWTDGQIAELEKTRKPLSYAPIMAPRSGVVIEKRIVSGSAVKPGELLYRISDLSKVWVEAELYDEEISLLSLNDSVSVTLPYLPDKVFNGYISFIYPYLFDNTRTGRVRIVLDNPRNEIRPGTYSDAKFSLQLGKRLVIPKEAVIFAGETRIVFVDRGNGKLEAKRVKLGVSADPFYEVLEGINEGDTIVTSGNFLIASEAKIKLGIEKW